MGQVVFLVPGLVEANCYAAKPAGQLLPADASGIPTTVETLADQVCCLLAASGLR